MQKINGIHKFNWHFLWLHVISNKHTRPNFFRLFESFSVLYASPFLLSSFIINKMVFIFCCLWSFRGWCLRTRDFSLINTFHWASERGDWMSVVARCHGIHSILNRPARAKVVNKIENLNRQTGGIFLLLLLK